MTQAWESTFWELPAWSVETMDQFLVPWPVGPPWPAGQPWEVGPPWPVGPPWSGDMLKSTYDPTNVSSDVFSRANHTWTQNASTISDFQQSVNGNKHLRNLMSTSLISWGWLTINADTTKFDIASFTAVFVDNYTDPLNPTYSLYTYPWSTWNSVTNLATQDATYISVNSSWTIFQTSTNNSWEDSRDKISLGSIIHPSRTQITSADSFVNTNWFDVSTWIWDVSNAIWIINSGNIFSANWTNLKINKSAGTSTQVWLNWKNSKKNPNITTDSSLTAPTFILSWRNWTWWFNSVLTSDIVPWRYDDGTWWATQPNWVVLTNKWSLHKVYYSPDAQLVWVEYWQASYNSLAEAEAAKSTPTTVNTAFLWSSFRWWIIVRWWATTLNSTSNAIFIDAWKFGSTTSGAWTWSATTTLQQAYDNSTNPEILTDATRWAFTVRQWSWSDADNVFEVQNWAWSVTTSITGNWNIDTAWNVFINWTDWVEVWQSLWWWASDATIRMRASGWNRLVFDSWIIKFFNSLANHVASSPIWEIESWIMKMYWKIFTTSDIELWHATDTTISRVSSGKIAVEWVNVGTEWILQNSKSAAYTTVLTDAGKHIYHPSSDTTARTWTIDSNANVAYPIGTVLTFVNDTSAGTITIAITSDTLVMAGTWSTGSRTLADNWIATALKVTSTRWQISWTNLS